MIDALKRCINLRIENLALTYFDTDIFFFFQFPSSVLMYLWLPSSCYLDDKEQDYSISSSSVSSVIPFMLFLYRAMTHMLMAYAIMR